MCKYVYICVYIYVYIYIYIYIRMGLQWPAQGWAGTLARSVSPAAAKVMSRETGSYARSPY